MCVTTTRAGGFSSGPYESLNLGAHVEDATEHVNKNRQRLIEALELPNEPMWLDQRHGNDVIQLTQTTSINSLADAAYTNKVGVICAVLTADCLPLLLCDVTGEYVAVAHAGWRGVLNGVIENTVQALPGENPNIMCWLGPAIGPSKFEVGKEVVEQFFERDAIHENAFRTLGNSKYLANIYKLVKNILTKNGVNKIYGGEYCTYSQKNKFFFLSKRRTDRKNGNINLEANTWMCELGSSYGRWVQKPSDCLSHQPKLTQRNDSTPIEYHCLADL